MFPLSLLSTVNTEYLKLRLPVLINLFAIVFLGHVIERLKVDNRREQRSKHSSEPFIILSTNHMFERF